MVYSLNNNDLKKKQYILFSEFVFFNENVVSYSNHFQLFFKFG